MAKVEVVMKSYFESAAMTGWKRFHKWRPGQRAFAKRLYNRRVRREVRPNAIKESLCQPDVE